MLEEFLYDIITKNVLHQLHGVAFDLLENLILLVAVSILQFLLYEARSMLIATEFNDMAVNILSVELSPSSVAAWGILRAYLQFKALVRAIARPKILKQYASDPLPWILISTRSHRNIHLWHILIDQAKLRH
jgi:hypothetical protein